MKKLLCGLAATGLALAANPALAENKGSSAHQAEQKGMQAIPQCTKRLGTIAIVEPDNQWWREMNLGSPEAIIKVFVQQSGCFSLVNRGRSMDKHYEQRGLADSGELQRGSNLGKRQVRAADYFLEPNIVTANKNSGGSGLGGIVGGFGGAVLGGLKIKKSEASVTLSVVNVRTTEEVALSEGYARKSDVSFGGGGGGWFGGAFAGIAGGGYQDTEIGQVIVLAYLDSYIKLVDEWVACRPTPLRQRRRPNSLLQRCAAGIAPGDL